MHDILSFTSQSSQETAALGASLSSSLYEPKTLIRLFGELGSGKTTFVQGLAKGLGIEEVVTSPTFALEQRYGGALLHQDLYRLDEKSAREILRGAEEFPGIRVVEWPERAAKNEENTIDAILKPLSETSRSVEIQLNDAAIPDDGQIARWIDETDVLPNIRAHMNLVTDCVMKACDVLLERKIIIRPKAVRSAAKLHDLFRFLDFPPDEARPEPPSWKQWRIRFGAIHERALASFLHEQGFPVIGTIVRTHGGPRQEADIPTTIEQKVLNYCDKRVLHDKLVSLDERFDDFLVRSRTSTPEFLEKWRTITKIIEKELFGDNLPF